MTEDILPIPGKHTKFLIKSYLIGEARDYGMRYRFARLAKPMGTFQEGTQADYVDFNMLEGTITVVGFERTSNQDFYCQCVMRKSYLCAILERKPDETLELNKLEELIRVLNTRKIKYVVDMVVSDKGNGTTTSATEDDCKL